MVKLTVTNDLSSDVLVLDDSFSKSFPRRGGGLGGLGGQVREGGGRATQLKL